MSKTLPVVYIEDMDSTTCEMFAESRHFQPLMFEPPLIPDLICFTGGSDVSPALYNEDNVASSVNPTRDKWCIKLLEKYPDVPKVGICRGGQFLNVMSGGSMYQDVDGHCNGDHGIINLLDMPNSSFHMGTTFKVTSTHHQMMIAGDDGEVLAIANQATKFIGDTPRPNPKFDTEVIWYEKTKSLCYQPHPEYDNTPVNRVYFFDLLKHFFGM